MVQLGEETGIVVFGLEGVTKGRSALLPLRQICTPAHLSDRLGDDS
jgi:hypothetical protein